MSRLRSMHCHPTRDRRFRPAFEALEKRDLLAWPAPPVVFTEVEPNDVINEAQDLGPVDFGQGVQVQGQIGNGADGGADVDFYCFEIDEANDVTLALGGPGIVTLYNNDPLATPLGHQQLLQFVSSGPLKRS